mgnify:FL=1
MEIDCDSEQGNLRDQIAIKSQTIKFLEEKIDELLVATRHDSVNSGVEDEVFMFYSQGVDTLKAEIIDLEREIYSSLEPDCELDETEALREAIQGLKVMLFEHNLVSVSGGNAWLVHQKLAEAYSCGIKKLEDEMAESRNDL